MANKGKYLKIAATIVVTFALGTGLVMCNYEGAVLWRSAGSALDSYTVVIAGQTSSLTLPKTIHSWNRWAQT